MGDIISSPSNPRVKDCVALRRRRVRDERGEALIEGFEELTTAVEAGAQVSHVMWCPELMAHPEAQLQLVEQLQAQGARSWQFGRAAFEKAAYREGPDGFLAVAATPEVPLTQVQLSPDAVVVVCESVEKPGNVGAILRTADAVGAAAVVAANPVTDWANPNVVRASKAAVYSVPVASGSTAEVQAWLDKHEVAVVATTPDAVHGYTEVRYDGRVAIAVGAEKHGLSPAMLERARHRVVIPMVGRVNSLNVATSAAVVMYEVVRQRGT